MSDALMPLERADHELRRLTVARGLASPQTLLFALKFDGFRVEMPPAVDVPADRIIPVPKHAATMLDVVRPSDQITLIEAWEGLLKYGLSQCIVHLLDDDAEVWKMTFVDAREDHGVHLVFLGPLDPDDADEPVQAAAAVLAAPAPLRPLTGTMRKSNYAVITDVDDSALDMLSFTRAELIGQRSTTFIHPDDHDRAFSNWKDLLINRQASRIRLRHQRGDGSWVWLEVENEIAAGEPGSFEVDTRLRDLSDEMEIVDKLEISEKRFRRLTDSLPLGLIRMGPNFTIDYANDFFVKLFGLGSGESMHAWLSSVSPDDRSIVEESIATTMTGSQNCEFEITVQVKPDAPQRCSITLIPVGDLEGDRGLIACFADITESTRLREELERRASVDALTGCANRDAVMTFLAAELEADNAVPTAVIFLDVNQFKPINDSFGHAAGDEVLRHVGHSLTSLVRKGDLAGRLGGDEFLLVLPAGAGHLQDVVDRIANHISGPVAIGAGVIELSLSIGAVQSRPQETADDLVARADAAMYACKQSLRDQRD